MAGNNMLQPKISLNLNENFLNERFSHIYVEEEVAGKELVRTVLDNFPKSKVVPIKHYKDIFNRPGQEFLIQKQSQKLILARRKDNFLYEGSPVCERYGHSNFYYTTQMMNCLYNCSYCYLQTLYPSANIVAFVNPEDYFPELKAALGGKKAYISLSYDADILALEHIFGYVKIWAEFARKHKNLTFEVRTKSANFKAIANVKPADNMILAWTVSPGPVTDAYEEGAPSLSARIDNIKAAIEKGWKVRLCLDPVLPIKSGPINWERQMGEMLGELQRGINLSALYDISIGAFRMSKAQYKKLRRLRPNFPNLSLDAKEVLEWKAGQDFKNMV